MVKNLGGKIYGQKLPKSFWPYLAYFGVKFGHTEFESFGYRVRGGKRGKSFGKIPGKISMFWSQMVTSRDLKRG